MAFDEAWKLFFFCSEDDSPSILELVDAGVEATQNGVDCKSIVFEPFGIFKQEILITKMYSIRDDQDGNGTIFKKILIIQVLTLPIFSLYDPKRA